MTENKKPSFADKFKGGKGGFVGAAGAASSGGFAKRFRPSRSANDDTGDVADSFAGASKKSQDTGYKKIVKQAPNKSMGVAEKVRRKRSQNVFLVRGNDRGRAAWHYVLLDNNKRELFLAATRRGALDVADYGEVLCSGWGEDPPESVVKRIEDEFNL